MFNYDSVEIHFNVPIQILTFSRSHNFIKNNQNKMLGYLRNPGSLRTERGISLYETPQV